MSKPSTADLRDVRVCLLTTGHVGSNPRLVKEAGTFARTCAGVHVIALDVTPLPEVQARDRSVALGALWTLERLCAPTTRIARAWRKAVRHCARLACFAGISTPAVLLRAASAHGPALARAAAQVRAHLYIAHTPEALAAAAKAARSTGARFAYDAEDFVPGISARPGRVATAVIRAIESSLLPHCSHVTAASPLIADAYARAYGIAVPPVILNVFPLHLAPALATPSGWRKPGPSLLWFSQTIGLDRGLETVLEALALARSQPHVYLQGTCTGEVRRQLENRSRELGIEGRLHLLEPVDPAALLHGAASFDLGLAPEDPRIPNRDICLTNKIFSYLLAGLPVIASATRAQVDLAAQAADGIRIAPPRDPAAWAAAWDQLLLDPPRLAHARASAWSAGQSTFNWECAEPQLLQITIDGLNGRSGR